MKIFIRNIYLSKPRFDRYLKAVNNNDQRAEELYLANIRLAKAFHPIISQFEVVLRNSIDNHLTLHFSDNDWILNQTHGFMNHISLSKSNYFLKSCVLKTESTLRKRRISLTSGKIIADQNLGFWLSLFLPHHFRLLSGQVIHIFSNKPPKESRSNIYNKLNKIRDFRNRINHCEPICFNGNSIDCSEARFIRDIIYLMLDWMNSDLTDFFMKIDNIENEIQEINNI